MLRYFVISTVLVVGLTMLVAAWVDRDLIRIKIASVYARYPAKPVTSETFVPGPRVPVDIEAPWALSTLPDCLLQTSKATGPLAFVRKHLPPGAVPIAAPATLVYGNCTISIAGGEAVVRRGPDRFVIPPHVQFYRTGDSLVLLRSDAGANELRVYEEVKR